MSPIPTFTGLGPEPQYEDIVNKVNLLVGELRNLMLGMDSVNMFEVGGWLVTSDQLASSDGDVGMSTLDTAGDDIRFWAGDAIGGIPKFKVTKSGILSAVDGNFEGSITSSIITGGTITGSIITGGTVRTASSGARIELSGNSLKTFNSIGNLSGFVWGDQVTPDTFGDAYLYSGGAKTVEFYDLIGSYAIRGAVGAVGFVLGGNGVPTTGYGTWEFPGSVTFSGTVSGLSTNTIVDHNHGVTPGRYLMTYDNAGVELGLQFWNASGGHSHTVS